jgi:hypothetical protein
MPPGLPQQQTVPEAAPIGVAWRRHTFLLRLPLIRAGCNIPHLHHILLEFFLHYYSAQKSTIQP